MTESATAPPIRNAAAADTRIIDLIGALHGLNHDTEGAARQRAPHIKHSTSERFLRARIAVIQSKTPAVGHDPEKWIPVFGKDHAPTKCWSGMTIRGKVIPLQIAGVFDVLVTATPPV